MRVSFIIKIALDTIYSYYAYRVIYIMIDQPFSAVFSNHITSDFPELHSFILNNYYSSRKYKKNDIVHLPDPNAVYYIKTGSVKSFISDDSGMERLMYIMLSDTITSHSIHDYFLKTLVSNDADTELLAIRRNQVMEFLAQNSQNIEKWEKITLARYGILLQRMLQESHCSSKYKVYSFIMQLATLYGIPDKNDPNILSIEGLPSVTDIASITGVHRSNATTYINELKEHNVFLKTGNKLIISDMKLFGHIISTLDQSGCNSSF